MKSGTAVTAAMIGAPDTNGTRYYYVLCTMYYVCPVLGGFSNSRLDALLASCPMSGALAADMHRGTAGGVCGDVVVRLLLLRAACCVSILDVFMLGVFRQSTVVPDVRVHALLPVVQLYILCM